MPGAAPAVPEVRCPDSGSGYLMGGPLWAEPIHDFEFVKGESVGGWVVMVGGW